MKRIQNPCRKYEESICLLASGSLPEADKAGLEEHLAACSGCQEYHREIQNIAMPLASWEQGFDDIEPSPAMELRWASAIRAFGTAARPPLTTKAVLGWCRELIWPFRHVWAGMFSLWLVLWGVNLELKSNEPRTIPNRSARNPVALQALEEQRRLLAELLTPPPTPSHVPVDPDRPRPRSERSRYWKVG